MRALAAPNRQRQTAAVAALNEHPVRVQLVALDSALEGVADAAALLSPDERARAGRFHFEQHRRRFTACRRLLRIELGKELGIDPADVSFSYGPFGKPALAEASAICFNVSHSGAYALLAIGRDGDIGIDIEEMRPIGDLERLAETVFSPFEQETLLSLPPLERPQA